MMTNKETRAFLFEVRADQNEEHGHFLVGTPIVFNQRTTVGWYDEIIASGALDQTDLKDVRFLIGHNTSMIPLARSRNNNANSTMQLMVTGNGMDIRVDLDTENNADARTLYSAVNRGDISGMSFMFTVDEDSWEDLESEHPTRTITSIGKVFEVSAVAFPAYEGTSMEARSAGDALDSARASLESAKAKLAEERAAKHEAERLRSAIERLSKHRKEADNNE